MLIHQVRAIVVLTGRPNVGKSLLFNRLVGKPSSLVDSRAGCTRDVREAPGQLVDLRFRLFDTPGLEWLPERLLRNRLQLAGAGTSKTNLLTQFAAGRDYSVAYESLHSQMMDLTERFFRQLSAQARDRMMTLFLVDASQGVVSADRQLAKLLRKLSLPTVLVLNKCDLKAADPGTVASFAELGFPEPVPISAKQGEGFAELYEAMQPFIDRVNAMSPENLAENDRPGLEPAWQTGAASMSTDAVERSTRTDIGEHALKASSPLANPTQGPGIRFEDVGPVSEASLSSSRMSIVRKESIKSQNADFDARVSEQAAASTGIGARRAETNAAESTMTPTGLAQEIDSVPNEKFTDTTNRITSRSAGDTLRLAIIGRPNVGKSTLINALMGYERLLAAPYPGVTRDNVTVSCPRFGGVLLTDTAGARRPSGSSSNASGSAQDSLEKGTYQKMLEGIAKANVCCLVLDAAEIARALQQTSDPRPALADIEHRLIQEATELHGRPLLIVLNKVDLLSDESERARVENAVRARLQNSAPEARHAPIFSVCAPELAVKDAVPLLQAAQDLFHVWSRRWSRTELTYWLGNVTKRRPPPVQAKFAYVVQSGIRPPEFTFFGVRAAYLPPSYRRTLLNALKSEFSLEKVPVRLRFRSRSNPKPS
ncbi:hypothetical protein F1559_000061 [Cyanidiococcus yangmingshanensis]|uniref:GTPase Der n=1 Tax=Cyanidiococcus yangmingshanensis TaxID=2690220 RepID=A0A7J7IBU6_9RHOD|nr:hypothetical protein F1559_000061 [Cyanidiococcus yangmingshanensis]